MDSDSVSSVGEDQAIDMQDLVHALVDSDAESGPIGDVTVEESLPVAAVNDDDVLHTDAVVDEAQAEGEGTTEENPETSAQEAEGSGEGEKPKRKPITFGRHSPPTMSEARKHTAILPSGKFTREHKFAFVNSSWRQQRAPSGDESEAREEGVEQFRGMCFTGTGLTQAAQSIAEGSRAGSQYGGSQYGEYENKYGGTDYDQQRPYYQRPYHRRPWNRPVEPISYEYVLNADEAQEMLAAKSRFCFDDKVSSSDINQHHRAIPETLAWKTTTGKATKYIGPAFICPHHKSFDHFEFTKDEMDAESYRTNLIYKMLCDGGIMHVEDMYKTYLDRNRMEPHPFDGFNHFHRFITDRSHIFGMDQFNMVYNENMLVTLAVMRYAHALQHGTPVERAPGLFSTEKGGLFYRAFLAFMSIDDLSFDTFFYHFPAIFTFDEVWTLNKESASKIPSAFNTTCLPMRDTIRIYEDRSQVYSGVGRVVASNIAKIKIQSEECLRKSMHYFVGVPIELLDDVEKYPIGTRVAYTAVRVYNAFKDTLHGTSVELEPELEDKKSAHDGTIEGFWSFEDEGIEEDAAVENTAPTTVKESETLDETPAKPLRILDIRYTIAEREHERQAEMLALARHWVGIEQLWVHVASHFPMGANDYFSYIEQRPFLFAIGESEDGRALIKARSPTVQKAMQDYICSLGGKRGASVSKAEAIEMCTARNEYLPEADRFTFEDLKQCIRVDKLLVTNEDGKPAIELRVEPLFYWSWEHEVMMNI